MKKFFFFCICLFLLVGCANESKESKEVRSINDFENASINAGFSVSNNINKYSEINYITSASVATLDDISLEMVIYTDTDNLKKVQDEQIENFKLIKNTATTEHKEKGKNYYKYWMVSNGYYMVSSSVDNTLVFCKTPLGNKEKVEAVLDNLGY